MSNTDFDPDSFINATQPAAAPSAQQTEAFDPDKFLASSQGTQPAVTTPATPVTPHQRLHAVQQGMASESATTPAGWGSPDVVKTPIDAPTSDDLIRMWKDVGKGLPEGLAAAVTGGIAGDFEGAIRQLLAPYGASQQTYLPSSVEGGPVLGQRGLGLNVFPPAETPERAGARQLGSMMLPLLPSWMRAIKGGEELRAPPAAPPEVPKLTTPRTSPAGDRIAPDLLPPDTPHELPAAAPAGAQTISPLQDIGPEAIQQVHNSLQEAGFTPHTLAQRLEEMSPHEFGLEVGGTGGAPWRAARGIVVDGGQGGTDVASAMRQRLTEGPQRVTEAFDRAFGGPEDLSMLKRSIQIDQQKAASPLYQQFHDLKIQPTQQMKDLIPKLNAAGAFGAAKQLAALEGKPWNQSFFTTGAQKTFPTAESWDMVKRALDAKIESSLGPFGKPTVWTRAYTRLKNDLVDAIDNHPDKNVAGVWKQAREAFAGPQQIQNALDLGGKLLSENISANELPFMTAKFSDAQMAAVRQGVRSYLNEKAGRPGNTTPQMVKQLLGPNNQAKLRWFLGDEKADELIDALNHEQDMHNSPRGIFNQSATAEKQVDRSLWQPTPSRLRAGLGAVAGFVRHPIGTVVGHGLEQGNAFLDQLAANRMAKIRDDAARIYTMQGPERDAVFQWILEHGADYARQRSLYARGGAVREPHRQSGGAIESDEVTAPPAHRGVMDQLLGTTGPRYQTWPEKVVRGVAGTALRGATLPGDVAAGRTTPDDPSYYTRATDLASTALVGATSAVPEGTEAATGLLSRALQNVDEIPAAMVTSKSKQPEKTQVDRMIGFQEGGAVDPGTDEWSQYINPETGRPRITIGPSNAPKTVPGAYDAPPPTPDATPPEKPPQTAPSEAETEPTGGPTPEHRSVIDQLLGLTGPRFQTWPERMIRSGVALPHDVATGQIPYQAGMPAPYVLEDPTTGRTSEEVIERAQDMAALAGGAGAGAAEEGALGMAGGKLRTPTESTPPLYSAAEKAVQGAKQSKATGEQWAGWLKNQPGIKPEEVENLNLDTLPAGQVSKDQLLQHIGDNKTQLNERWFAGKGRLSEEPLTKYSEYQMHGGDNYRELLLKMPSPSQQMEALANKYYNRPYDELPPQYQNIVDKDVAKQGFQTNHWPSDPNTLMHLRMNDRNIPGVGDSLHLEELQSDWHQKGRKQGYGPNARGQATVGAEAAEVSPELTRQAMSRVKDVLEYHNEPTNQFDYEVKYDRPLGLGMAGAGGSGHMYDLIVKPKAKLADRSNFENALDEFTHTESGLIHVGGREYHLGDGDDAGAVHYDKDGNAHIWLRTFSQNNPVPDAPFKNTNDWAALGLKRAIVQAAKEGKDSISWTPGQQQADRYDLSKHIDSIRPTKNNNGTFDIDFIRKGSTSREGLANNVPPEKLADHVGKDLASKILEDDKSGRLKWYKGLDLKVGGEGMKKFYDDLLPNVANKIGKKYGAKVEYRDLGFEKPKVDISNLDALWYDPKMLKLYGYKPGASQPEFEHDVSRSQLPEYIGTEASERLLQSGLQNGQHTLQTLRPGEFKLLRSEVGGLKVPVLRLTPQLKEQALKGMPLFARGGTIKGEQEAFSSAGNTNQSSATANSAFARGGAVHCCIDASHDVISGADSTPKKVEVDRHIPAKFHKYLAAHEEAEAQGMKEGMSYAKAHAKRGIPAERKAVEADGVNWNAYTEEMAGYLSHIEHEKVAKPPPAGEHVDPHKAIARAAGGRVVAKNINHNPTPAQKEVGNYAKDHIKIHGLDIAIENAKGSTRKGVGKDGKTWKSILPAHYGYIKRTEGSDGDHVDVYLGPHIKSTKVWVIDQINHESKAFDEHKVMLGFGAKQQVINTYQKAFSDGKGKDRIGSIKEMSIEQFKTWLKGDTTQPVKKGGITPTTSEKITRGAFIYLPPKKGVEKNFAQCGPCRMFVGNEFLPKGFKGGRCVIHGSKVAIDVGDSCGFMVPWPTPDGKLVRHVVEDHAKELARGIPGSVTPEQSGLISSQVRCENCKYTSGDPEHGCGLYRMLNQRQPEDFDLDPEIESHGCCNAWTSRTK